MILRHIIIENFKQFDGKFNLTLARGENNVTVLLGENGAGKTTFLTAVAWCLHGEKESKGKNAGPRMLWKLKDPKNLLSYSRFSEMNPGSVSKVSVELEYEHGAATYRARREVAVTKEDTGQASTKTYEFTVEQTTDPDYPDSWRLIPEGSEEISRVLPLDLLPYFLFKGETAGEWVDPRQAGKLREAVKNILDLTVLERTDAHTSGVIKELEDQLRESASGDQSVLEHEIKRLGDAITSAKDKLEDYSKEKGSLLENLKAVEDALNEYTETEPLIREKGILKERKLNQEETKNEKEEALFKMLRENAYLALLEPALKSVDDQLEKAYQRDDLPARIKPGFVDELLLRGNCICTTDLGEGSAAREGLVKFRESGGLDAVAQELQHLRGRIGPALSNARKFQTEFLKLHQSYEEVDLALNTSIKRYRELDAALLGKRSDKEALDKLLTMRTDQADALARIEADMRGIQRDLGEQEILREGTYYHDLKRKEEERKAAYHQNKLAARITKQIDALRAIRLAVHGLQERWLKVVQQYLDDQIQTVYDKLAMVERDIHFDEDYVLSMRERVDGQWVNSEPSGANQTVLALCFVACIIQLAAQGDGEGNGDDSDVFSNDEYPMVMDAPFAKLGGHLSKRLPNYLADTVPQLILLTSEKQWEGEVEAGLRHRVGRAYSLNLHTARSETREVSFLGKSVPFVTQNTKASTDYSTIESIDL